MPNISVKIDKKSVMDLKESLDALGVNSEKIIERATKKAMTRTKNYAVDQISKVINLNKKRIGKDFTVYRSKGDLRVSAKGAPPLITSFSRTRVVKGKGIFVKPLKNEKGGIIYHTFIAKGKGGSEVPYQRAYTQKQGYSHKKVNKKIKYAGLPEKYKYTLWARRGPRIEDIYARPEIFDAVLKFGQESRIEEINKALEKILQERQLIDDSI